MFKSSSTTTPAGAYFPNTIRSASRCTSASVQAAARFFGLGLFRTSIRYRKLQGFAACDFQFRVYFGRLVGLRRTDRVNPPTVSDEPSIRKPFGFRAVMENGNQAFLQRRPQVDQHVAATDEVEFGKRRVFHHVLFREDAQFAHAFADLVVGIHFVKKRRRRSAVRSCTMLGE